VTTNEMIGNGLLLFAAVGGVAILQSFVTGVVMTGKPPNTRLWRFGEHPVACVVIWLLYLVVVTVLGTGGFYLLGVLPGVEAP